ncbi:hypothetical protein PVAND_002568 [Polypedilum vanderplanki]|uniref:Uncharacterized protein n=1 Tax=Polypedilum vanderplanki TaxID=319348 RepID=A0A9J6BRW2_POLVA|nr:hypothetical protein PVAND_002568 [Polypedilum vanderplanki]
MGNGLSDEIRPAFPLHRISNNDSLNLPSSPMRTNSPTIFDLTMRAYENEEIIDLSKCDQEKKFKIPTIVDTITIPDQDNLTKQWQDIEQDDHIIQGMDISEDEYEIETVQSEECQEKVSEAKEKVFIKDQEDVATEIEIEPIKNNLITEKDIQSQDVKENLQEINHDINSLKISEICMREMKKLETPTLKDVVFDENKIEFHEDLTVQYSNAEMTEDDTQIIEVDQNYERETQIDEEIKIRRKAEKNIKKLLKALEEIKKLETSDDIEVEISKIELIDEIKDKIWEQAVKGDMVNYVKRLFKYREPIRTNHIDNNEELVKFQKLRFKNLIKKIEEEARE